METFVLFILAVLLGLTNSQDICPSSCNCTIRNYSSGVAKCTILDSGIQRFSAEIAKLQMKNLQPHSNFYLSDKIFYNLGLEHVSAIEIINSTLRKVDVNAFRGLKHLRHVDLSHNDLVDMAPKTFIYNENLHTLKLNNNPLQLTIDSPLFESEYITELDISHCDIIQLSPQTLSKLKNLQRINLSYNKIKILDRDVFTPLEFILEVDLAFNEINYISPDTFSDSEDMTVLSLKGNPITSLEELNISDLGELDVSECQITGLFSNSLEGVNKISQLNLSHNSIETIDSDAFSSLTDLTYIYLSHNNLKGPLSEFLFEQSTKLEVISFSHNPNMVHLNGFKGEFAELYTYDISHCGLSEIINKTFSNMHFIATLNVSGNNLKHIEANAFSKLIKLKILDLSKNKLHYLPSKIFSTNHGLEKLYIGNNAFHHIPAALFLNTPKMFLLDVSNCHLNYLWNVSESILMKNKGVLEKLFILNVAGNKLKKLHLQNFISLKMLGQLDISNNPFECTQSFGHVMEWLIIHRVLPNKGKSNHPIEISDEIENNVVWDETLKTVCPIAIEEEPLITKQKVNILSNVPEKKVDILSVTEKMHQRFEKLKYKPTELPNINKGETYIPTYVASSENDYVWPLTLIAFAGLCLILALGNIAFLMVYKARRNYRLVSYKSHFPNPLGGLSQVRLKNAPLYQKLYEDCSVPKTPIVKNSHGKCVVTCISDPDKAEAV